MQLLNKIKELKKSNIRETIDKRILEFKQKRNQKELFKELCFCLMTANFRADKSIMIQKEINDGFLTLTETQLAKRLKELGYRFPNTRAKYIYEARRHIGKLPGTRDWLYENIKGLGMKESSHYLRNVGHDDYAIIDFHIVDVLTENGIITKPKNLNPKTYLQIENELKKIGEKTRLTQAELDLYLWYMETGKILK